MKIIHENEVSDACRAALEAYNDAKPKDGVAVLGVKPYINNNHLEGLVLVSPEGRENVLVTVPMVGINREAVARMDAWETFFAHVPYGAKVLKRSEIESAKKAVPHPSEMLGDAGHKLAVAEELARRDLKRATLGNMVRWIVLWFSSAVLTSVIISFCRHQ